MVALKLFSTEKSRGIAENSGIKIGFSWEDRKFPAVFGIKISTNILVSQIVREKLYAVAAFVASDLISKTGLLLNEWTTIQ
jgi:hypothetical protein